MSSILNHYLQQICYQHYTITYNQYNFISITPSCMTNNLMSKSNCVQIACSNHLHSYHFICVTLPYAINVMASVLHHQIQLVSSAKSLHHVQLVTWCPSHTMCTYHVANATRSRACISCRHVQPTSSHQYYTITCNQYPINISPWNATVSCLQYHPIICQ